MGLTCTTNKLLLFVLLLKMEIHARFSLNSGLRNIALDRDAYHFHVSYLHIQVNVFAAMVRCISSSGILAHSPS